MQKAIAAGIPGEQVDGNDIIAVRMAAERALARARRGEGPSLIEAVTYRLSDHTTADDASRYRKDAEVSRHWRAEPVARLHSYLLPLRPTRGTPLRFFGTSSEGIPQHDVRVLSRIRPGP